MGRRMTIFRFSRSLVAKIPGHPLLRHHFPSENCNLLIFLVAKTPCLDTPRPSNLICLDHTFCCWDTVYACWWNPKFSTGGDFSVSTVYWWSNPSFDTSAHLHIWCKVCTRIFDVLFRLKPKAFLLLEPEQLPFIIFIIYSSYWWHIIFLISIIWYY